MKKIVLLLVLIVMILLNPYGADASPSISAKNAVVLDLNTREVLYDKHMDEQASIASITKIMTAFVAIEHANLDDDVTVSPEATMIDGSSIYSKANQTYSMEDLLYGLMLRSGNDAAASIADYVGGSTKGFAYLMNETASWLGMQNSSFQNPHGLEEEDHYSTAYDMALLTAHAMKKSDAFREIFGTEKYLPSNGDYYWFNKNKLLSTYGEYCTGGKTGFTQKAGRTLVTTAQQGEHEVVVVTLDAADDWNDHKKLYDYAFHELEKKPTLPINSTVDEASFIDLYVETFKTMLGNS